MITVASIVFYWVRPTQQAWGYLLVLMTIHLVIDFSKNIFSDSHPQYFLTAYFFDQALHIVSIAAVAFWMAQNGFELPGPDQLVVVWMVLGLVLVTDVWRITERIFAFEAKRPCSPPRLARLHMLGRACLFTSVVLGVFWLNVSLGLFAAALLAGIYWFEADVACPFFELRRWFPWRLAGGDITISLLGATLIGVLMLL